MASSEETMASGAEGSQPKEGDISNPQDLVRLLALLQEIKTCREVAVATANAELNISEEKEELYSKLAEAQEDLLEKSGIHSVQTLAVQRLQLGDALAKILFDEDDEVSPPEKERVEELVKQQTDLSSSILAMLNHQTELNEKLEEVQRKRREVMHANKILMKELQQLEKEYNQEDNDTVVNLKAKLEDKLGKLCTIQNVLQGLIVGSNINWAKDPELQEILLSLSKTDF